MFSDEQGPDMESEQETETETVARTQQRNSRRILSFVAGGTALPLGLTALLALGSA